MKADGQSAYYAYYLFYGMVNKSENVTGSRFLVESFVIERKLADLRH